MAQKEIEIPLMKGSMKGGSSSEVHGVADVRLVIVDATIAGKREPVLALVTGDQVVVIENAGKPAQQWLREAVLKKLGAKSNGGVEQG